MSTILYRIQDKQGRGPYRPGFSSRWSDVDGPPPPKPFYEEFGWAMFDIPKKFTAGFFGGCGFRTLNQLRAWFSESECKKLEFFGYRIVRIAVDRIIQESENQVVFERKTPLKNGVIGVSWKFAQKSEASDKAILPHLQ